MEFLKLEGPRRIKSSPLLLLPKTKPIWLRASSGHWPPTGLVPRLLPWAACSRDQPPSQWRIFPSCPIWTSPDADSSHFLVSYCRSPERDQHLSLCCPPQGGCRLWWDHSDISVGMETKMRGKLQTRTIQFKATRTLVLQVRFNTKHGDQRGESRETRREMW